MVDFKRMQRKFGKLVKLSLFLAFNYIHKIDASEDMYYTVFQRSSM